VSGREPPSRRGVLIRLATFVRPHMKLVVYSTVALVLLSAIRVAGPLVTMWAIDDAIDPARLGDLPMADALASLQIYIVVLVGIVLSSFGLQSTQMVAMNLAGQRTMHDLRMAVFSHIQRLGLRRYDRTPVGTFVTRVTSDVNSLDQVLTAGVDALCSDLLQIVGIVIVLLALNWQLALITFIALPIMIVVSQSFRVRARAAFRAVREKVAVLNAYLQESISGIRVVSLFAREQKTRDRFGEKSEDLRDAHMRTVFNFAMFFPAIEFCTAIARALLLVFGAIFVTGESLKIGEFIAFWFYVQMFFEPIRGLSDRYNLLQQAAASSERIFKLMDREIDIPNPETPHVIEGKIEGDIRFEGVRFAYDDENWVLKDIDLHVRPGEKVALVGATGAGKTSMAGLASRLYDVQHGRVLIDGVDVRDYDKRALRRQIAVVLQDVFLFSGDIARNIRLGEESITDEALVDAARTVNVHPFIESLPDGYATRVQERGATLSVGQKQLLSFARALAMNPSILVLDEATSSVDTETERLIQGALERLLEGRTALIIAHRLSTVQRVDRIVVMHRGEIREVGTHQELLRLRGIYHRLYQLQYDGTSVDLLE
jgi:ATP-binding cassette, subfamily B, multidrug efflux pump